MKIDWLWAGLRNGDQPIFFCPYMCCKVIVMQAIQGSSVWNEQERAQVFEQRQDQLRRDRKDDRLDAWLEFEDEMDEI